MAWDDPYDSGLISSIDPRISGNPYIDEAAGLRIQNQYLDQQRGQNRQAGWGSALTQEAERNGLDPDFLQRIIKIESGGDPNNRTGSYGGLFQLSKQEFNKYGGGNIFDPTDNIRAGTAKLAAERDAFKDKYGRDPSPTDLYLTHQQGEGGYGQHMANPDRPAWENMFNTGEGRQKGAGWARQAIWGNIPDQYKKQFGSVDNVTSADFVNMWRNKVEGDNPGVMADGPATGSPAGPPVDASNLGSVAAAPYGRTRMDDTQQQPPGNPLQDVFSSLFGGGQRGQGQQQQGRQQPGLLGALSDPMTMAYLGMMVKGLNPSSKVDPDAMMKVAENARQHASDLGLRQQQLGLNTRAQNRQDAEFDYKQQREEAGRRALSNLFGGDGGTAGTAAPGAPGAAPTDASAPQGRMTRENISKFLTEHPDANPATVKFLTDRLAALDRTEEERGKLDRTIADKTRIADRDGLTGADRQEYIYGVKSQDKALPAGESGRLALADIYLRKAPEIAKEIDKGNLTGPYDVTMGKLGAGRQGTVAADIESGVDALRRMLTGQGMPASEAEAYVRRYQPSYVDTVTSLKSKHQRLVEELTGMRDNMMRGRGPSPSPSSQVGGRPAAQSDPLGIR